MTTQKSKQSSKNGLADLIRQVESLLRRARVLERDAAQSAPEQGADASAPNRQDVAQRLSKSVIRPLADALVKLGGDGGSDAERNGSSDRPGPQPPDAGRPPWETLVFELAKDATRLCLEPGIPPDIREAAAGLQLLAIQPAPSETSGTADSMLAVLRAIQSGLPRQILTSANGPYLTTNVESMTTRLGERMTALPLMALCRCGASAIKPFCDGTHAEIGFTAEKDPTRVPDRRDTYDGQQVTILDNRGLCQHSGFCSDRLATVFRVNQDPFVAPSGGRMDEIIRAVRDCPSGALSYAIDGQEARQQVEWDGKRGPSIEVSRGGPYRITGGIPLLDHLGNPEPRNEGASLEHYALCRCGHSQNKPFCSGAHWYVNFQDPIPDPDRTPTVFEWAGGFPALTKMTRLFYERYVPEDPLLAPLFANMSPDHPERVASWLGETFGGSRVYTERYGGYDRMVSQHLGKELTEEQRARWVRLILQSADDVGLPNDPEFRAAFVSYIEWGSRIAKENSQPGAHPPMHMPVPRWWWVCDATPGSRVSALASRSEDAPAVELPAPGQPISFAKHIKPLFRDTDRTSMSAAFDLWSYQDVVRHAEAILGRLQSGTMPCDGAWSTEKVEVFSRWLESETPE
jgi:CDGSH-type Zn-finger protein/truncated hemoglobin YjbI